MNLEEFREFMAEGRTAGTGTEAFCFTSEMSQRALRITMKLNQEYHTPDEICALMSELIGQELPPGSFGMFPPFYTDFGLNIHLGEHVFLNSGCRFQDQGGITIGDRCLIGHGAVLVTLNHEMNPEHRGDLIPAPIHIGKDVWLGANVTVLPGVTIGDGAVIGAGAVVTKDIPAMTVAAGVPAKVIRKITPEEIS